jgi:hypothetical protein
MGDHCEGRSMRLFHFSEDADIRSFTPRPVAAPTVRRAGREWLNALSWKA